MFDFIEGIVERTEPGKLVIENDNIGYSLDVPISLGEQISAGQKIRLYVYLIIRDEVPCLYGFKNLEQRQLFCNMIAVSGIGPRMALNILGIFSLSEFAAYIESGNLERLTKVPHLGKKKAQHLITDIAGKIPVEGVEVSLNREAEEALISLGYKKTEATRAIASIKTHGLTTEQLVRQALQNLSKKS